MNDDRLHVRSRAEAQRDILRQAIDDYLKGAYEHARNNRKCPHGIWSWDACEQCISEHFEGAVSRATEIEK